MNMFTMKRVFLSLVLILSACSFVAFPTQADDVKPIPLSMIELIANGDKFDGKVVQVIGIPFVEFEASYLFPSKSALESADTATSVYLQLSKSLMENIEELNGKFVYIVGKYSDIEREALKDNQFTIGPVEAAGSIYVDSVIPVQPMK